MRMGWGGGLHGQPARRSSTPCYAPAMAASCLLRSVSRSSSQVVVMSLGDLVVFAQPRSIAAIRRCAHLRAALARAPWCEIMIPHHRLTLHCSPPPMRYSNEAAGVHSRSIGRSQLATGTGPAAREGPSYCRCYPWYPDSGDHRNQQSILPSVFPRTSSVRVYRGTQPDRGAIFPRTTDGGDGT